ncbi:MAG: hypothetical protein P1P84_07435 [Deferrisomatales bacterium]|nr:hypothetical protein [Deferrisomatales bacterium]
MTRAGDLPRDELLRALTEAATQAVRAERVVVFGPWARGSESPGDPVGLLVILADPLGGGLDRRQAAAKLGSALGDFRVPKRILVFTEADEERWQSSPAHPIGQVLGKEGRSGPDPESAHLLLDVAARHLKAVHGMAEPDLFDDEIFGFHCHAAVAGALRAWLALTGGVRVPPAEDLVELLACVGEFWDVPEPFREFGPLNVFAHQCRFVPLDEPLEPGERRRWFDRVRRLHEYVQGLLAQIEHPIDNPG